MADLVVHGHGLRGVQASNPFLGKSEAPTARAAAAPVSTSSAQALSSTDLVQRFVYMSRHYFFVLVGDMVRLQLSSVDTAVCVVG